MFWRSTIVAILVTTAVLAVHTCIAQPRDSVKQYYREISRYYEENDPVKKGALLAEFERKMSITTQRFNFFTPEMQNFKASLARCFAEARQWEDFRKIVGEITNKETLAKTFNGVAWNLQKKNEDMEFAEEFAKLATEYKRNNWLHPAGNHDPYTQKAMEKDRKLEYAQYANTYAMVLYRLERYREGFRLAKEAALEINQGEDPAFNNTYALLAEYSLSEPEIGSSAAIKLQLEKFVREGKSTEAIKHVLKKIYVAERKSENGFEEYIKALERDLEIKVVSNLVRTEASNTLPEFQLKNLKGETVASADFKGKITVVYFWAMWCGPCISAFPVMEELLKEYKDNPDLRFVFVDTWELGDDKEKVVSNFIAKNKYPFEVLLDSEKKVATQFSIQALPTKIILDRDGKIRAKILGYDGSSESLKLEIRTIIGLLMEERR